MSLLPLPQTLSLSSNCFFSHETLLAAITNPQPILPPSHGCNITTTMKMRRHHLLATTLKTLLSLSWILTLFSLHCIVVPPPPHHNHSWHHYCRLCCHLASPTRKSVIAVTSQSRTQSNYHCTHSFSFSHELVSHLNNKQFCVWILIIW